MTKLSLPLVFWLLSTAVYAQDSLFARKMLDTLTSPHFWGRGYTREGMQKTAGFIEQQFRSDGLQPLDGKEFTQPFSFSANTFPGAMSVSISGRELKPGRDFIIGAESRGFRGVADLSSQDSTHFVDSAHHVFVTLEDKLTWSVEKQVADYTWIELNRNSVNSVPAAIRIHADNRFVPAFQTGNVCGLVPGTVQKDSFIVMSAHYDHLGGMGADTYFPGANDNASGLCELLDLARYYARHPQPYTMVFICFSGEEAGLMGSSYFSENPLIPLSRIRFLMNMDIVGTGGEGITVVNATMHPAEYSLLVRLNEAGHYLPHVAARGGAPNSDHYCFSQKGVPSFYIYTMGGSKAYHDIFDAGKTLPLTEYVHLFKLLVDFNSALMGQPLLAATYRTRSQQMPGRSMDSSSL